MAAVMMSTREDEASKLFTMRRTLLEMLGDRGYIVLDELLEQTLEEFRTEFDKYGRTRDMCTLVSVHRSDPTDTIYVFFPSEPRGLGVKALMQIIEKVRGDGAHRCILVLRSGLTPFSKQAAHEAAGGNFRVETFIECELMVNITKHAFVPRHKPLTDTEKTALLTKYKVSEDKLPRISEADPVARYYGLRVGQVVKILRASETAGRYVTYRIVAAAGGVGGTPMQRFW
jgi:DNA-directed RNA polymerase I, II, and III subunit RPABC1